MFNYSLNKPSRKKCFLFKIFLIFLLVHVFTTNKLSAQRISIEPGFLIGQSIIEREDFEFSGDLFETSLGFDFYKNNSRNFTWSLGAGVSIGQLNFDDLQIDNLQRYTIDFVRLPVFFNFGRNFFQNSDNATFSVILSAGVFYKAIFDTEIFDGEEVFDGENENTFGFAGKFGFKIHLSKRIYTLFSINASSDFSDLNLSEDANFRIMNERSFGLAFGFSF